MQGFILIKRWCWHSPSCFLEIASSWSFDLCSLLLSTTTPFLGSSSSSEPPTNHLRGFVHKYAYFFSFWLRNTDFNKYSRHFLWAFPDFICGRFTGHLSEDCGCFSFPVDELFASGNLHFGFKSLQIWRNCVTKRALSARVDTNRNYKCIFPWEKCLKGSLG